MVESSRASMRSDPGIVLDQGVFARICLPSSVNQGELMARGNRYQREHLVNQIDVTTAKSSHWPFKC